MQRPAENLVYAISCNYKKKRNSSSIAHLNVLSSVLLVLCPLQQIHKQEIITVPAPESQDYVREGTCLRS